MARLNTQPEDGLINGAGSVPQLLEIRARTHRDDIAIQSYGQSPLSFERWDRRARAVATALSDLMPGRSVVGILADAEHLAESAIAYVGIQAAGLVALPLAASAPERELAAVLRETRADAVVACADGGVWDSSIPFWRLSALEAAPATHGFSHMVEERADIIYTSGTTGRPKGVVSTHGNILASLATAPLSGRIRRLIHATPFGSFAGLHLILLKCLRQGVSNLWMPSFDPYTFLKFSASTTPDATFLTPTMLRLLASYPRLDPVNLNTLRLILSFGAPAEPSLLARVAALFPKALIINAYGFTEAGGAITLMPYSPRRPTSVGRVQQGGDVRVCDKRRTPLSANQIGEIWLRLRSGDCRSYVDSQDPDLADVFDPDGWTRSGDIGYLDDAGFLYITGRRKELILVGGLNLSPSEIETELLENPDILEVAVVGMPDPVLGERPVAAVVLSETASIEAVTKWAHKQLGAVKTPLFVPVPSLPTTALGKVRRHDLRRQLIGMTPSMVSVRSIE